MSIIVTTVACDDDFVIVIIIIGRKNYWLGGVHYCKALYTFLQYLLVLTLLLLTINVDSCPTAAVVIAVFILIPNLFLNRFHLCVMCLLWHWTFCIFMGNSTHHDLHHNHKSSKKRDYQNFWRFKYLAMHVDCIFCRCCGNSGLLWFVKKQ